MQLSLRICTRKLGVALFASVVFLFMIHMTGQAGIHFFGANKRFLGAFHMDHEFNIPTIYSAAQLASCAFALHYARQADVRHRRGWTLLSRVFAFLAFDELFQLHELFVHSSLRFYVHPALANTWVIPYGLFVICIFLRLRPFLRNINQGLRAQIVAAGAIYCFGALGMEMIDSFMVRSGLIRLKSFWHGLNIGIEESLEIAGVSIFLLAISRYLISPGRAVNFSLSLSQS
jgi:hypothetical protein